jgi:DNA-binding transcriptional regulator YiaG
LTQAAFADLIGTTANSVARWERNELGMKPTTERLIRLVAQQQTATRKRGN